MKGLLDYSPLEKWFAVSFHNHALYQQALTTPAFQKHHEPDAEHHGTLEFFGDAAIRWGVTHYLISKARSASEGTLTEVCSQVVSAHHLAQVADKLHLADYANISSAEVIVLQRIGSSGRTKLLCDLLEAVVGAVTYEHGHGALHSFFTTFLFPRCDALLETKRDQRISPKNIIQRLAGKKWKRNPRFYTYCKKGGWPHEFVSECCLGTRVIGKGSGLNRREAEAKAAQNAIDRHFPGYDEDEI